MLTKFKNIDLINFFTKHNFNKVFKICFILSIKNGRAWFFIILSSISISLSILTFYSIFLKSAILLSPQILSITTIPFFISPIYFTFSLNEWKETNLIKRLKFIQVRKIYIIISFLAVSFLFAFLTNILIFVLSYLCSFMVKEVELSYLGNLFFWNWIWFIFSNFLITFIMFSTLTILNNICYNKNLSLLLTIFVGMFQILTSDVIIPTFTSSESLFMQIIGYFSFTRYPMWISLLTSSFTFIDYSGGIRQLIFDQSLKEAHIFIKELWVSIVVSLVLAIGLLFLSGRLFKWK